MNTSTYAALLLVDGYNIIGSWSSLKQTRDQYGLELARQELVEALINYSAHQGYQTQVVFDAQMQRAPATAENPSPHLSVYYTDWMQTADTYIEKRCAQFFRKGGQLPSRLIVATSDRAQQLTVVGYGAEWMSAQLLARDVGNCQTQVKRRQKHSRQSSARFLFNALDATVQEKLRRWRHDLY
jgi:hypothetical protein